MLLTFTPRISNKVKYSAEETACERRLSKKCILKMDRNAEFYHSVNFVDRRCRIWEDLSRELSLRAIFIEEGCPDDGWRVHRFPDGGTVDEVSEAPHSEGLGILAHHETDGIHQIGFSWNDIERYSSIESELGEFIERVECTRAIGTDNGHSISQGPNRVGAFIRFEISNFK